MANESIVMPSVTSTLHQHGGPQAAMPVSRSPAPAGEDGLKQASVEPADKVVSALPIHAHPSESRMGNNQIEEQAQELQEKLANLSKVKGWTINFSLVPELDRPVIRVIDAQTEQVIRQIPSEEMLLLSKRLKAMEQGHGDEFSLSGLLFDGQV
ncbi:flagellar protein FlaG [Aeromonas caviae]|uniref:flagellar protein FlaG n=1 Tax=Aeromonas caviae TaxID=648 RepID=UPI00244AB389|nr:flagellar protein FlaG [Aeromonas caviae]MDH1636972.1 flagellar protein FlaG [Aeromonas caviae]